MVNKLKSISKHHKGFMRRFTSVIMLLSIVVSCVFSFNTNVEADDGSSSTLGTAASLNSPIFSSNFTSGDWNKWEMITWGVFLSNFCIPFIDNYETAFTANAGSGSKGAGLSNLEFGTGNDPENNKTIASLLTNAISYQTKGSQQDIVVQYAPVNVEYDEQGHYSLSKYEIGSVEPPNSENTRTATFNDLWFGEFSPDDTDKNKTASRYKVLDNANTGVNVGYDEYTQNVMSGGNIPIFYVHTQSGEYVKILDFTNSWDIQIFSCIANRVLSSSFKSDASSAFNDLRQSNPVIKLDTFGNIVAGNKMCFAASANQHITKTDSINIINSWIFSGYSQALGATDLVTSGRATDVNDNPIILGSTAMKGYPAFGGDDADDASDLKLQEGAVVLYFDLDTVALNNWKNSKSYNYGDMIKDLFNQSLSSMQTNIKIEAYNTEVLRAEVDNGGKSGLVNYALRNMVTAGMIANMTNSSKITNISYTDLIFENGETQPLISDSGRVAVVVDAAANSSSENSANRFRRAVNFMYQQYNSEGTIIDSETINKSYVDSKLLSNMTKWTSFYKGMVSQVNIFAKGLGEDGSKWTWDSKTDGYIETGKANRMVVAYTLNDTMASLSKYFSNMSSADFATYSKWTYCTYLVNYGINTSATISSEDDSNFNTKIFNSDNSALKMNISEVDNIKSDEQMKKELTELSYLMLSNDSRGQAYKQTWLNNLITNFAYNQYTKTVYGGASDSDYAVTSTNNDSFLNTPTYTENFLTGGLLGVYEKVAIVLILGSILFILIFGIINSRKISWFITTMAITINMLLILPSIGEIVPYTLNNTVQSLFSSKMTFWSISEQASNTKSSEDYYNSAESVSSNDPTIVQYLVNNLSSLYTDRSLMLKQDISTKVNQKMTTTYANLLNMKSTQWLLPALLQQYSASDSAENYNYVYKSLANTLDDCSNLYWYYEPSYATKIKSVVANSTNASVGEKAGKQTKTLAYSDYVDNSGTTYDKDGQLVDYRSYSWSNGKDETDIVHSYFYLLRSGSVKNYLVSNANSYVKYENNKDSFRKFMTAQLSTINSDMFEQTADNVADLADNYSREDRSTIVHEHGYLWATESPMSYFYSLVQDSISSGETLGSLVGLLTGEYSSDYYSVNNSVTSQEARKSNLLYATSSNGKTTGLVRDVLDLEEMFTNTVPYLYKMSIAANGYGDIGGMINKSIGDTNTYYKGSDEAWMFRCNWATKLIESPEYSSSSTVRDCDGKEYNVANQMMPECYPSERPMVFSEAQKQAYKLSDSDLTLVELKCIKLNNDIARDWTTLINYCRVDGVTLEVMVRQMAVDATNEFCSTFSPSGVFNNKYKLYPSTLDLRNLSFDSLMRMLVLNTTGNSSASTGNLMKATIDNGDVLSCVLLLLVAWICVYIIPILKQVVMAILLVLVIMSIAKTFTKNNKSKLQITCGVLLSNIVFILLTTLYYLVFSLLIKLTSTSDIINIESINVQPSSMVACYFIIIITSILYGIGCFIFCKFTIKHRDDMGFGAYTTMISGAIASAKELAKGLAARADNAIHRRGNSGSGNFKEAANKDTNNKNGKVNPMDAEEYNNNKKDKDSDNSSGSSGNNKKEFIDNDDIEDDSKYDYSNKTEKEDANVKSSRDSEFIDNQVKQGEKNIDKKEKENDTVDESDESTSQNKVTDSATSYFKNSNKDNN